MTLLVKTNFQPIPSFHFLRFRARVSGSLRSRFHRAPRCAFPSTKRDSPGRYGTDALAASYAAARRLALVIYAADHEKHPGLFDADGARNAEMARDADALIT
ncbi:MAG TPA: hypothetical protein VKE74_03730 [Gemmataceae bacterium]|nr:hypothetical protein [Gemmataceae bacterium]